MTSLRPTGSDRSSSTSTARARRLRGAVLVAALSLLVILVESSRVAHTMRALGPMRTAAPAESPRVLVFTRTEGYRHGSIPVGIAAIEALGAEAGFTVEATEDPARFSDEGLRGLAAVVFLNTTGDVLDPPEERAFERYVQAGGGFVGVHAATDTEYDWPWYGALVGAYFARHPRIQQAGIEVLDHAHPSTSHLDARWTRRDEWYDFRDDPSERVTVLLDLDETSYEGGGMGAPHPIAWHHEHDGGRAWYTAMGHTAESYAEPAFRAHLLGGILWAAGLEAPDATATVTATATVEVAPTATVAPMKTPTPAPSPEPRYLPWSGCCR